MSLGTDRTISIRTVQVVTKLTYAYKVLVATNKANGGEGASMSSVKRNVQNTPKIETKVTHAEREASGNKSGVVIAAFEIPPQDVAIMSLGIVAKAPESKSFLVECQPEVDISLVTAEVTTYASITSDWHYLLEVANASRKMVCIEVREVRTY